MRRDDVLSDDVICHTDNTTDIRCTKSIDGFDMRCGLGKMRHAATAAASNAPAGCVVHSVLYGRWSSEGVRRIDVTGVRCAVRA